MPSLSGYAIAQMWQSDGKTFTFSRAVNAFRADHDIMTNSM